MALAILTSFGLGEAQRAQGVEGDIYVLTPKGDIIPLVAGATRGAHGVHGVRPSTGAASASRRDA